MVTLARFGVSALVFLAAYLLSFWVVFAQIFPLDRPLPATVCALLFAAFASRCVWNNLGAGPASGTLATAARYAAIGGAVGFCGGFFGPMLFAPDANQGPLLGIFLTGPAGTIAGGLAGLARGFRKHPKSAAVNQ
ncbi:MAG: hypothetical protein GC160_08980 [Acidobacteria bacterium]|nr:hypothetical protein [Acidobacteriota bacterium]